MDPTACYNVASGFLFSRHPTDPPEEDLDDGLYRSSSLRVLNQVRRGQSPVGVVSNRMLRVGSLRAYNRSFSGVGALSFEFNLINTKGLHKMAPTPLMNMSGVPLILTYLAA